MVNFGYFWNQLWVLDFFLEIDGGFLIFWKLVMLFLYNTLRFRLFIIVNEILLF